MTIEDGKIDSAIETVNILIEAGADTNNRVIKQLAFIIMLLFFVSTTKHDFNICIDKKSLYRAPALVTASAVGNIDLCRILVKAGADVNIVEQMV